MLDLLRQRQGAQEVGEVVGRGVELEPHCVVSADGLSLAPAAEGVITRVRPATLVW